MARVGAQVGGVCPVQLGFIFWKRSEDRVLPVHSQHFLH